MESVTIGFSKSRQSFPILSWIIRFIEKSEFSHTYVKLHIAGRELVYQASGFSVHFSNMHEFEAENEAIWELPLVISKEEYSELLRFCFDHLNKPYSIKQLFGILYSKIFRRNPISNGPKGFICSEISYLIAKDILKIEAPRDSITPQQLYEILQELS